MKKLGIALAIIAIVGGAIGGYFWYQASRQNDSLVEDILREAAVDRGDLNMTVATSGKVVAQSRLELSLEVPGIVEQVGVAVGDRVAAGDELASIVSQDLELAVRQAYLNLQIAELNLQAAQKPIGEDEIRLADLAITDAEQQMKTAKMSISLAQAQAALNLRQAKDTANSAQEAYDRLVEALNRYHLPDIQAAPITAALMEADGNVGITEVRGQLSIEQAQSQWQSAYQAYQQAMVRRDTLNKLVDADQIQRLELQIEQAQLTALATEKQLAKAILRSPISGTVAAINIVPGMSSPMAFAHFVLLDDSAYYVDVNIDEIDIPEVHVGQPVHITLDAYSHAGLEGTINEIAPTSQNLAGIISYPVRIKLADASDIQLRDGMTANVVIETVLVANAVRVPNWAIRTDQESGGIYVYVLSASGIEKQDVIIGLSDETYTEIRDGLEPGMTVVLISEKRDLLEFQGPPSRGL